MGNCCQKLHWIKLRQIKSSENRQIAILLIGLDNAGKTTVANGLSGKFTNPVLPTVGFSCVNIKHKGHSIVLYDVGGGSQIRGIWSQYYGNVHGFIFIIDASDVERLNECKEVFSKMIWHDKVSGKPILIFLNKQDKEGTMHEFDITEQINVETLVNLRQCPTKVEICSALPTQNNRCRQLFSTDPSLDSGFRWLVSYILLHYDILNNCVSEYEKDQLEAAELKRNEWKKRRKLREQQAVDEDNSSDETNFTNPFKPISSFLKNSANNGSNTINGETINKTSQPVSNGTFLGNHDITTNRSNEVLVPVEINNVKNSVKSAPPSVIRSVGTINNDNDDSDVRIFYSRSPRNESNHDLSIFTISGQISEPQVDGINFETKNPPPGVDLDKKSCDKSFFSFKRFNKTAPATVLESFNVETEKDSTHELLFLKRDKRVDEVEGSKDSVNFEDTVPDTKLEPFSYSNTSLLSQTISNNDRESSQSTKSRTKGIFTRNKPVSSSAECILTDSDNDDVVF